MDFENKMIISFIAAALSLLTGWFWYDKTSRDGRLHNLEKKVAEHELAHSHLITELTVVKSEARHARELVQVQLAQVNTTLAEIKLLIQEKSNG